MASSLPYDPFDRETGLPCGNTRRLSEDLEEGWNPAQVVVQMRVPVMKQTEALLASEMYNLSADERNTALDDVHCVGKELQETPELVQKSLDDFDQAVRRVQSDHPIYEIAKIQNRAYAEDPAFRLKFLRANFYNIDESVSQMMTFLHHKAENFGQDKVAREITLSDMREHEIEMLSSGIYHIQDGRDQMGRVIVHIFENYMDENTSSTSMNLASYYFWFNIILTIPEAQVKGVTAIYHSILRMPDITRLNNTIASFNSLPLRISATHCCVRQEEASRNLVSYDTLLRLVLAAVSRYARVRFRSHFGTSQEIQYQLRDYGIPTDTFPVDMDGNVREDILNIWFQNHVIEANNQTADAFQRTEVDQLWLEDPDQEPFPSYWNWNDASSEILAEPSVQLPVQLPNQLPNQMRIDLQPYGDREGAITPTDMDVLFGKGYRLQVHPGNIRFREFLKPYVGEYDDSPRQRKAELRIRLAQTLRNDGVRFLHKAASGEWVESNLVEAEKKIGQMFREFRKKQQNVDQME